MNAMTTPQQVDGGSQFMQSETAINMNYNHQALAKADPMAARKQELLLREYVGGLKQDQIRVDHMIAFGGGDPAYSTEMLEENQQFRPIIPKQLCVEPSSTNISSNRTANSGFLPPNGGVIVLNDPEGGLNPYSDTKRLPAGRVLSPKS